MALDAGRQNDDRAGMAPADADSSGDAGPARGAAGAAMAFIERTIRKLWSLRAPAGQALEQLWSRAAETWVGRYLSSTLLRRIVFSNILGLTILLVGVLYISQFNIWLTCLCQV